MNVVLLDLDLGDDVPTSAKIVELSAAGVAVVVVGGDPAVAGGVPFGGPPPLHDVHGRFGLSFEARRKALEILKASSAFRFFGGQAKVRYGSFLREVARSKICIDLPSYSPITFRLIDYLAIGACIIGPPHQSRLHVPLQDRVHLVYCKPDYSDLEALCSRYLEQDTERRALVEHSRTFFDAHLHRDQLASYYLKQCARLLI